MRITDRSPTGRLLQTIFIPAEVRPVMPSEISDEIVLVHPALPPMVGFKEGKFFHSETAGGLGSTEVFGPVVPTERYWWVQLCDVRHDDPVDRTLSLGVRDTSNNDVFIFNDEATRAAGQPTAIRRPFLLGNDLRFVGRVDAIAAGQVVNLRFFFLEFFHAEISPTI